ncbi:hypothetical protein TELCIR_09848 [Teladorsagia circumcincta]|uniref:Uncharacterized protein n=1 Tax=Teladorsagia circumcincta TaxID=45464 RepID=A0A2G9UDN1_TELCI|nr:hypothetical protein TELCIR_09848 [Teladorsagia circumcincta]
MLRGCLLVLLSVCLYVCAQDLNDDGSKNNRKKVEDYIKDVKKEMQLLKKYLTLTDEKLKRYLHVVLDILKEPTVDWMYEKNMLDDFIGTFGALRSSLADLNVKRLYKKHSLQYAYNYVRFMGCLAASDLGRATAYLPGWEQRRHEDLAYARKLERNCAFNYFKY